MTTVAVPAPSAADVEHFNEVYRKHAHGLVRFARQIIYTGQNTLAEDIVQDALTEYWRTFVLPGRYDGTDVFSLLATIVRRKLAHHLRRRYERDRPVDFTDAVNTPVDALIANGRRMGTDPQIAVSIDTALDVLSEAIKVWRRRRYAVAGVKGGTASVRARIGEERAARFAESIADRLARAEAAEIEARAVVLAAWAEVARLRDLLYPNGRPE